MSMDCNATVPHEDRTEHIIAYFGLSLYGLAYFFSIVFLITSVPKNKPFFSFDVPRVFYFILLFSFLARLVWLDLELIGDYDNFFTFLLNRIAFCTFFSSFTLVVFNWAENFHKNYIITNKFLPKVRYVFVIVNLLLYLLTIAIVVTFGVGSEKREGSFIYELSVQVEVVTSFLVAIGFAIYGGRLVFQTRSSYFDNSARREIFGIVFLTAIFVACFLLRVIFFFYRLVFDKCFSTQTFYTCAYFIPDVIPAVLQTIILQSTRVKLKQDSKYIDDLYAQAEEDNRVLDHISPPTPKFTQAVSHPIEDYTNDPHTPLTHQIQQSRPNSATQSKLVF